MIVGSLGIVLQRYFQSARRASCDVSNLCVMIDISLSFGSFKFHTAKPAPQNCFGIGVAAGSHLYPSIRRIIVCVRREVTLLSNLVSVQDRYDDEYHGKWLINTRKV